MKGRILSIFFMIYSLQAQEALAESLCSSVLVPNLEQSSRDARSSYAYIRDHASLLYDQFQSMSSGERGASAQYKMVSGSYNESNSKAEFVQKVNSLVDKVLQSQSGSEISQYYKTDLSESQITAWAQCASNGGILLSAKNLSQGQFNLRIDYIPARGLPAQDVILEIDNAYVDGKSKITLTGFGAWSQTIGIKRGPVNLLKPILIRANTRPDTAELSVDDTPKRPVTLPKTSRPIGVDRKLNISLQYATYISGRAYDGDGPDQYGSEERVAIISPGKDWTTGNLNKRNCVVNIVVNDKGQYYITANSIDQIATVGSEAKNGPVDFDAIDVSANRCFARVRPAADDDVYIWSKQ